MNKYSFIFFKSFQPFFIISFFGIQSCANLTSDPNQNQNPLNPKIQIYTPSSNSTISEGENSIFYDIAQPYSIKFIELYINDVFIKNIPPNADGTLPLINFYIDSSYIDEIINIILIYYDNEGVSFKSNTITGLLVKKNNCIPFKPYNISLLKFNDGSCRISWKDSSCDVEEYELWRKTDFAGEYILHQELSSNTFNTNDYGLDTNKIYFYKLRSVNASGNSDFSSEVNTAGIIFFGNLFPPTNLTANYDSTIGVIRLDWFNNDINVLLIDIERKTESTNYIMIKRIDTGNSLYLDFNITNNKVYTYRIRGFDLNTYSDYSNEVTVSTF